MSRITTTALALFGATAALGLAACGSSSDSSTGTATSASAPVTITDPWARVTPGNAKAGAAYMTISSTEGDRLTDVSVPGSVAAMAQLHETTGGSMGSSSGAMTMKEVGEIPIPAGGSVTLRPGGYHVMLLQLAGPITAGETIPLTLTFAKAGTVKVNAVARAR